MSITVKDKELTTFYYCVIIVRLFHEIGFSQQAHLMYSKMV